MAPSPEKGDAGHDGSLLTVERVRLVQSGIGTCRVTPTQYKMTIAMHMVISE